MTSSRCGPPDHDGSGGNRAKERMMLILRMLTPEGLAGLLVEEAELYAERRRVRGAAPVASRRGTGTTGGGRPGNAPSSLIG